MEQEAEEAAKKKKVEEEEEKARKEKEEEEKTGNATEEEEKKKKQEEEDNEEEEKKNAEEKPKRSAAPERASIGRGDKRLTRTLRVFINKKSGKDQFQSGLGSVIVTTRKQSAPKVVFDLQWKGSFASPPKPQQNCVSPVTPRGWWLHERIQNWG